MLQNVSFSSDGLYEFRFADLVQSVRDGSGFAETRDDLTEQMLDGAVSRISEGALAAEERFDECMAVFDASVRPLVEEYQSCLLAISCVNEWYEGMCAVSGRWGSAKEDFLGAASWAETEMSRIREMKENGEDGWMEEYKEFVGDISGSGGANGYESTLMGRIVGIKGVIDDAVGVCDAQVGSGDWMRSIENFWSEAVDNVDIAGYCKEIVDGFGEASSEIDKVIASIDSSGVASMLSKLSSYNVHA